MMSDRESVYSRQKKRIEQLQQELKEAKAELIKRNKQLGVACLEHDLIHSLCCGHCLEQAEKQRDALAELCRGMKCPTDTDGDGNCHLCARRGGCYRMQQLKQILKGGGVDDE